MGYFPETMSFSIVRSEKFLILDEECLNMRPVDGKELKNTSSTVMTMSRLNNADISSNHSGLFCKRERKFICGMDNRHSVGQAALQR
jgi:hypothetical protein